MPGLLGTFETQLAENDRTRWRRSPDRRSLSERPEASFRIVAFVRPAPRRPSGDGPETPPDSAGCLQLRAAVSPEQCALRFLVNGETEGCSVLTVRPEGHSFVMP